MTDKTKTIGVCLSQAHTFLKTDLISELGRAASQQGYRVIAFNSELDYYWAQMGDYTTSCIYDLIQYDQLSALVIQHDNIYDLSILNHMIQMANAQGIPVFYLGGVHPDCVSIMDDYETAYKALLRHVIRDHGVTDTFYIAGLREEDNSLRRLRYYREVLEENGIPYREENVAYGNYLEMVAADITQRLIAEREHLPRAILCANDSMASAVCDTLKSKGYRIPQDVIVTGFDGTPTAYLVHPQLSTCNSNPGELADQMVDLVLRFYRGEPLEKQYSHQYKTLLMESCGCPGFQHPRFNALHTYRQAEAFVNHENVMYYAIEQLLALKEQIEIFRKLAAILLPDSVLYINRSLLESDPNVEYRADAIEDDLIMVPFRKPDHPLIFQKVYRKDMPLPSDAQSGTILLSVVHADALVCGYYAAHTEDYSADAQLIKRLSDVLNLIFNILLGRRREKQLLARVENNLYMDPLTGMMNLKGLTRWFNQYVADAAQRQRLLAMSIYAVPRYSYIFETYGMEEIESATKTVASALKSANPDALMIARINEDQYAVFNVAEDEKGISAVIDRAVSDFFRQIEAHNVGSKKPYFLEVNCGCTTLEVGHENTSLENLIHLATGEMYLNRLRLNSRKDVSNPQIAPERYNSFRLLMEKNLLRFHFQPIVEARSGQICAYEALMRSDGVVDMSPLEILAIAREYNRLYDVEKATLFGIIDHYVRHYSEFGGCKVFINTIPGHFLSPEDFNTLVDRYGSYLDCFVLELTEDEPTSDQELEQMKKLCRPGSQTQIAIDDYGTGHSNIVNLLRYSPQIIKIDRALISGIEKDTNRQLFVRNTIDFAHQNHIRVLAEGVETPEELHTVIGFGVDLIQGFYTGRPKAQPIQDVDEAIRNEIIRYNLERARYDNTPLIYTMRDGETADLVDLGIKKFTGIQVGSGSFTLTGNTAQNVDMLLRVEDDAEVELTLNDVNMRGATEPTVVLGDNSRVHLILKGQNTLTKEGILVPATAALTLRGDGSLTVNNDRNYSVGIGARYNDPYGTITVDMEGKVSVYSSGDRVACLGGGRSAGEGIRLLRGACELNGNGINVLCMGSSTGDADIQIGPVELTAHGEGNEALLIGSVSGRAVIRSQGRLKLSTACERAVGVGTIGGSAQVLLNGGSVHATINCYNGAIIGSFSGKAEVKSRGTLIRFHGEGHQVAGFGSLMGACETAIESGEIHGELLAGDQMILGNTNSRCIITGGNFTLSHDNSVAPVSPGGVPLTLLSPEGDHFEQTFTDDAQTWTYVADRSADGALNVFIPMKE